MEVNVQDANFELPHRLSAAHLKMLREGSASADWRGRSPVELGLPWEDI
jgi:hypothetical protein